MGNDISSVPSPHQQGMLYILWQRLARGSGNSIGATEGAFNYLILQNSDWTSLPQLSLPPLEFYPGFAQMAPDSTYRGLINLFHRVALIRYAAGQRQDKRDLALELSLLNKELLHCENTMLDEWRFTVQEPDTPHEAVVFPKLHSVMFWNTIWMTRLGVLISLDKLEPAAKEHSAIRSDMARLVDSICCAVPHGLRHKIVGSVLVMRSLLLASQAPCTSSERRLWISRQLEFISRSKGVGPLV
jgi:hypothetical protein